MLQTLSIQNYALIQSLDIEFHPGLSILTGETGAGKSIIVGALSLIIGQRGDKSVLKDPSGKCVVEATFDIGNHEVKDLFEACDIDYEKNTIIRREINPNGKSRAFINDTPHNLSTLKSVGERLIDIHSQHQNLNLSNNEFQINVIDTLAGHNQLLAEYREAYQEYRQVKQQLDDFTEQINQAQAQKDYWQYQYDQLEKAALQEGEQEELEAELQQLDHAEEIQTNLSAFSRLFTDEQFNILDASLEAKELIDKVKDYMPDIAKLSERLESAYIELKDISLEAESFAEGIEYDPKRLNYVKERLDTIYSLQQKHQVQSVHELLSIQQDLQKQLDDIDSSDLRMEELRKELEQKQAELDKMARELTNNRASVKPHLEQQVSDLLQQLGIPNASFVVRHEQTSDYTPHGLDVVNFLFSGNKNEKEQEISRVASGGELSRLMMSLKYLLSKNQALPTIIFDEIDAGVSGEIAYKMGDMLQSMGQNMQVVNITHLPQIAGKGDHHYLVYKQDDSEGTHTYIKELDKDERITEIAKMLSGKELTDAALDNAKELLLKS